MSEVKTSVTGTVGMTVSVDTDVRAAKVIIQTLVHIWERNGIKSGKSDVVHDVEVHLGFQRIIKISAIKTKIGHF